MTEIEKNDAGNGNDDITIYNNPAAVHPHERGRKYYAVSPEGVGSYGSTPEDARKLLEPVRREYENASEDGRAALRDLARERVEEIVRAGGCKNLDAE